MARYQASEREARYVDARHFGLPPIVSEGDSWFSYEFYLNIIDRIDDTHRFAIKRLESSGDTMEHMVGSSATSPGVKALVTLVKAERPKLFLFSGGGNDIVGPELEDAFDPTGDEDDAASFINTPRWRELMDNLEKSYQILIDAVGPLCPIFAHGYDYFVPSNKPVRIFPGATLGPYVLPQMIKQNVAIGNPALQQEISRAMLDDFNDRVMKGLEKANPGYFAFVDLRGTVGTSRWENEIHPKKAAFADLAKAFLAGVDSKLPAVRTKRAKVQGAVIV